MEHENLISDSEYITLDHQTDVNKTHIKTAALKEKLDDLQQNKQDVLTAGTGITIQGNTISASAPTLTFEVFDGGGNFIAFKHDVTDEYYTLTTLSFKCFDAAECEITGELKEELKVAISPNKSISNGAVTISYDGTNMKLINSAPSNEVFQYGTFTFQNYTGGGGGGVNPN